MATYEKDKNRELAELAKALLTEHETHKPTLDRGVRIDFLFAFGDRDDDGNLVGDALTANGVRALGKCKVLSLKDRAKGLGDVEILIDHDWWGDAEPQEQAALLDHELHHIKPTDKNDVLGRPKIKLRKHDFQFGWFNVIAQRHGKASQERIQAQRIADVAGQLYWPDLVAHKDSQEQSARVVRAR